MLQYKKILVSGGAGFIGSAVVRFLIQQQHVDVVNVDALTYAGNLTRFAQLDETGDAAQHHFFHQNICELEALKKLFSLQQPDAVIHLAAETHVDRSIDEPSEFVRTNVQGTMNMLEASRSYWQTLPAKDRRSFRFIHVSTDEVYGDLAETALATTETQRYAPNSPYAASKAGADHLVRAWHQTYGLPAIVTMGCNNYGAYQHPEKLIPHMVLNALNGQPLPIYGDGLQKRQWLHVDDHARALWCVLNGGQIGQSYHIATRDVVTNMDVVHMICDALESCRPSNQTIDVSYDSLIKHVLDRPGHDRRYELNAEKLHAELGWQPEVSFKEGLNRVVKWYVEHEWWWQALLKQGYDLQRLGLMKSKV